MTEIDRLAAVMKRLRAPDGCPWDREQTHESLMKCLTGEVAEYLDAVADHDDRGMREELGDLLMEIVLNAVIAEERGAFTLEDAARGVTEKMIRRHPHVFGNAEAADSDAVVKLWDEIKKEEKNTRTSLLDGVPRRLALFSAEKMQKKAAKAGFDWPDAAQILDKIDEEIRELREAYASGDERAIDEESGDLLFAAVNFVRFRKKSPEEILAAANAKFARRFRFVEKMLADQGKTVESASPDEREACWCEAKKQE